MVSEQKTENSLEFRILDTNISDEDIAILVELLNSQWGDFFNVTPETMENRLNSGAILLAYYLDGKPVGLLETLGIYIHKARAINGVDPKELAREVCSMMPPNYSELTYNGHWRPHHNGANVLALVDITVDNSHRSLGIAGKMIDYSKAILLEENGLRRPAQLSDVNYVITFTPNDEGIKKWHWKNYAFDTEFVLPNARPNHPQPDVNFMCYLAPGYKPQFGRRQIAK